MPVVVAIDESLACADGDIPAARVVRYRKRVDPAQLVAAVELAVVARRATGPEAGRQLTARKSP
jgi:hypothetical protein